MYPGPVTTVRPTFGRRDDDPACRLRLEFSGGVSWRPILRAALDIWVPDALRARVVEIERTIVELTDDRDDVLIELRQEDDDLRATIGDRREGRENGGDHLITRRWATAPNR